MKTEYILLKEAVLNNNCPECYSTESLLLSFKQKRQLSKLFIKTKGEIIESMDCKKCETTIFPGRWTDDIERVYNYHKKTINSKSSGIQFTGLFYIVVLLVLIITGGLYAFLYHPELFQL
ncbi:hypothetical protein [uncultured Aquimarina sp.]|uniref:hypothetical protein n=1 Tax=uncultured Aquimarina sp. TaxID=575652 RepID=UPI0026126B08|nr:hypothetical protein [uncultured Aquimarina sp.]